MIPRITRRALVASLLAPTRRPSVAFHYSAQFTERQASWYSRFENLVTGGVLSPKQTAALRVGGSKLIAYEWSSAFYPGEWTSAAEVWQKQMRPEWSITPVPITGGAAQTLKPARWYDFANPDLIDARAEYLAGLLNRSGYDGFFFDTLGFEHLPILAQEAFREKHPDTNYNVGQAKFLAAVRKRTPADKIIFTNQGYRHADLFLPFSTLDLTESTFTYLEGGETKFRPWHDPNRPWESIRTPMLQLISPAALKFPDVRFIHLNYSAKASPEAILYSYAAAKVFGHESYLVVPANAEAEEDPIYSTALGRPLKDRHDEDFAAGALWRQFENGIVALLSGPAPYTIPGTKLTLDTADRGYVFLGQKAELAV